jgi:hypothetical protein
LGADETHIEASFCKAMRIAKEQKSVSLESAQKQPTKNTVARIGIVASAERDEQVIGPIGLCAGIELLCGGDFAHAIGRNAISDGYLPHPRVLALVIEEIEFKRLV